MARSRLESVVKEDLETCEIYMDFAKDKVRQRCLLMAVSTVGQGKSCSHCKQRQTLKFHIHFFLMKKIFSSFLQLNANYESLRVKAF